MQKEIARMDTPCLSARQPSERECAQTGNIFVDSSTAVLTRCCSSTFIILIQKLIANYFSGFFIHLIFTPQSRHTLNVLVMSVYPHFGQVWYGYQSSIISTTSGFFSACFFKTVYSWQKLLKTIPVTAPIQNRISRKITACRCELIALETRYRYDAPYTKGTRLPKRLAWR